MDITNGSIELFNAGTILATAGGQAIDFDAVTSTLAGQIVINNLAGGLIRANDADGIRPGANALLTNAGTIYAGTADGGSSDGIDFQSHAGSVHNLSGGVITGARHGITTDTDVIVINDAGGSIIGRNGSGVGSDGNGTVFNRGLIRGDIIGYGNGDGDGVDIDFVAHIENWGTIAAGGAIGVDKGGDPNTSEAIAIGGGTIINHEDGLIESFGGVVIGAIPSYIENHGVIRADLYAISTSASTTLLNRGILQGGTEGVIYSYRDTDDIIIAAGQFTSPNSRSVFMGGGNDTFHLQQGATFDGSIDGGIGNDLFILHDGATLSTPVVNFETLEVRAGYSSILSNASFETAILRRDATLTLDAELDAEVIIEEGGRLGGHGHVREIRNSGLISPGNSIGSINVPGNYIGNGGTLEIEAILGGDASPTDILVINGTSSGLTSINIINRNGLGAPTIEGIKIIDIAGASDGTFTLNGDYVFQGDPAVIAGAYGYRVYKNGISDPADGDWYLRSTMINPDASQVSPGALYQPGVPVYEAYAANLQSLNGLPTFQQRVANRSWSSGTAPEGTGVWGRVEGTRNRANPAVSTSHSDQSVNSWKLQLGADHVLAGTDKGERLIAGITANYGKANSHIRSIFGDGSIDTDGYGLGATLTWHGLNGFYVDGQIQTSWYNSALKSSLLGSLARNHANGDALSLEVGKRTPVGAKLSVTPQIQMAYSHVRFDRFIDPAGAVVASDKGDSLKSRFGFSLEYQNDWNGGRSHIYGIANLSYEWFDGMRVRVSGTHLEYADQRLWAEYGLGASVGWNNGLTLYGEFSGKSALKDFGNSYALKTSAGVRIAL